MNRYTACPLSMKALGWMSLLAVALLLASCNMPASNPSANGSARSSQSSWFNPDNTFKDPQALALARAAQDNDADKVRQLIKGQHINPDTLFGNSGFHDGGFPLVAWPVITSSLGGLKALLNNGANPNAHVLHPMQNTSRFKGRYLNNAMVFAAMNEDPAYLKLLLEHGGDPNTRNSNGETLLFQAYIWHNQWQNVKVLVEHGADVNAVTQGNSILGNYTSLGNFEPAYWLLQHGADPKAGDLIRQPLPPAKPIYLVVEDIFWYPANARVIDWQRKCQHWLRAHGFERPPMPAHYRKQRKDLGLPYEEKDIPLL